MHSVLSIQVGSIAPLGSARVPSAFVKRPIAGPIAVGVLGLEGDQQADLTVHGGPDKAVYFYASENYPKWVAEVPKLQNAANPGAFGENITSIGLDEKSVSIGDVFEIGTAQMQVTQPRQPCFKLGLRFKDNSLGRIMMRTGRSGWYVRVTRPGVIQAGDEIKVIDRPSPQWSIDRFNRFILNRELTRDELVELSQLPGLAEGWRAGLVQSLEEGDR
jgi:MOSC domain-containing protein YiiM